MFRRALLVLTAIALLGCGPQPSRRFAVTLLDSVEADCVGVSNNLGVSQRTMDTQAKDIRRAWETDAEATPPVPEGRLLRVNQVDDKMSAWFDPYVTVEDFSNPRPYADPHTVYVGDTRDELIEGTAEVRFNTDEEDKENTRTLCGARLRYSGLMTLTDGDTIQGRIRWSEYSWIPSQASACAGYVKCDRDVKIEGLEED